MGFENKCTAGKKKIWTRVASQWMPNKRNIGMEVTTDENKKSETTKKMDRQHRL